MQRFLTFALAAAFVAVPLFAGALTLQVDDTKNTPEAMAKNAVVAAHITACHSPEKTTVTATAEGIVNGQRRTIPLQVFNLTEPGAFAVTQQWPHEGTWTVTMTATNPDYKNYATSIVVPIGKDGASVSSTKVYYHAPSADEINSVLKKATLE